MYRARVCSVCVACVRESERERPRFRIIIYRRRKRGEKKTGEKAAAAAASGQGGATRRGPGNRLRCWRWRWRHPRWVGSTGLRHTPLALRKAHRTVWPTTTPTPTPPNRAGRCGLRARVNLHSVSKRPSSAAVAVAASYHPTPKRPPRSRPARVAQSQVYGRFRRILHLANTAAVYLPPRAVPMYIHIVILLYNTTRLDDDFSANNKPRRYLKNVVLIRINTRQQSTVLKAIYSYYENFYFRLS